MKRINDLAECGSQLLKLSIHGLLFLAVAEMHHRELAIWWERVKLWLRRMRLSMERRSTPQFNRLWMDVMEAAHGNS